ncbi:hypothetical protein HMI55_004050, partial [Coelomomyces lativittatus]
KPSFTGSLHCQATGSVELQDLSFQDKQKTTTKKHFVLFKCKNGDCNEAIFSMFFKDRIYGMTDMIQLHDSTMTIQISCFDALKDIPNPVQKMKISLNLQVLM